MSSEAQKRKRTYKRYGNIGMSPEETGKLRFFANALRDCLDLEPLYIDGRTKLKSRKASKETTVSRFYIQPHQWEPSQK